MAERLSAGNAGLALLANSTATGAGLVALILTFGSFSGAHFNPLVTVTDAILRGRPWRDVAPYASSQVAGAFVGVAAAEAMFGEPFFAFSEKARSGLHQILGEAVATFGLLAVVFVPLRRSLAEAALAVGAFIAAAYWFTSSTSFANPAVTLARSVTNTVTGIRPLDVPGFLAGQALGTGAFLLLARWLSQGSPILRRSDNG